MGLGEWIESALAPIASRDLAIGYHESPAAFGKAAPKIPGPAAPRSLERQTPKSLLDQAQTAVVAAEKQVVSAMDWADKANTSALAVDKTRLEQLQRTYSLVDRTYAEVEKTTKLTDGAENFAWRAEKLNRDDLKKEAEDIELLRQAFATELNGKLVAINNDKTKTDDEKKKAADKLREDAKTELDKKVTEKTKELTELRAVKGILAELDMDKELNVLLPLLAPSLL